MHATTQEKAMLPLGGNHRGRYRGRNRYRLFQTSKTDCDCDPDIDPDALSLLRTFSEQSLLCVFDLASHDRVLHHRRGDFIFGHGEYVLGEDRDVRQLADRQRTLAVLFKS